MMLEASKCQIMLVRLIFIVKCFNKQLTIPLVNYLKSFWNKPGMYMYQSKIYTGFLISHASSFTQPQLQSSYFNE